MKRSIESPSSPMLPGAPSESGLALIVLLAVALFVGLVGVAMMNNTVNELQIAVNQSNAVQARYLAEAGVADAANHLSVDNTWTGPVTQTLGGGTYTVQLDTATSQTGPRGAVKSVVSTGTVLPGTASGTSQTVRETFLVLPQAFATALTSGTTVTMGTTASGGATPTIQNTVLRQLGAIQANNAQSEATAFQQVTAGTNVTGQINYVTGTTTLQGNCYACAPAKVAAVPVPQFNFCPSGAGNPCETQALCPSPATPNDPYSCKAYNSATICAGTTGLNFSNNTAWKNCLNSATTDAQGFVNITGTVFVNDSSCDLVDSSSRTKLRITGTFVCYGQYNISSGCTIPVTCGDVVFIIWTGNTFIFNAQNGDPAIIAGGSLMSGSTTCNTPGSVGTITIKGLVVVLAKTINPSTGVPASSPGYCVHGSTALPVTITGAMYVGRVNASSKGDGFDSTSLTYDPSIFFQGLPTALVTPTQPFVVLPISWAPAK